MLCAVILGATQRLANALLHVCGERDDLHVYKVLSKYPAKDQLLQLMNLLAPEIAFIEITPSEGLLSILRELQSCYPRTAIIGFAEEGSEKDSVNFAAGSEVLVAPFNGDRLGEAINRAQESQRATVPDNIVAFLPAKAGSGATTVALHVAHYLAHHYDQKVLLLEADLHSGILSQLLNLQPEQSIIDALENVHWLNDAIWSKLVTKVEGLDLLPAPATLRMQAILQWNCRRLLSFARFRYNAIVVDLPDVPNEVTEIMVTEARSLYVVCTPEKPSLGLARRRMHVLKERGARRRQLYMLLNRHAKIDPKIEEIEGALGQHVSFVLPNDYSQVREAIRKARFVKPDSRLGSALSQLTRMVAGLSVDSQDPRSRFFSRKPAVHPSLTW